MQLREFVDTLKLGEIITPYANVLPSTGEMNGWCTDVHVLHDLVRETSATSIIELGSWEGLSAAVFVKAMYAAGAWTAAAVASAAAAIPLQPPPLTVLCIDTWLGSAEHVGGIADNYSAIRPYGSTLPLLGRFLRNMSSRRFTRIVFPFPATTSVAAAVLRRHSVLVDLVYIDASHEYEDVLRDLRNYWGIVRPGGVLFGDDYSPEWGGVMRAVETFKREIAAPEGHPEIRGRKFIFRKPMTDWATKVQEWQVWTEGKVVEVGAGQ